MVCLVAIYRSLQYTNGTPRIVLFAMAPGADLSSLLTASKNLTLHLSRPDLPSVQLPLDQIEAQFRRLVSRLPPGDTDRAYVPLPLPFFSDSPPKQQSKRAGRKPKTTFTGCSRTAPIATERPRNVASLKSLVVVLLRTNEHRQS